MSSSPFDPHLHFSSRSEHDSSPSSSSPPPGFRMLEVMKQQGPQLRKKSKEFVERLQSVSGSPFTRRERARWGNAWEAFYSKVLERDINLMPTGTDIVRFLSILPEVALSSSSRKVMAWGTMQQALKHAIHSIRLRHDKFRLTYCERHMIKDAFETLRIKGKLTTEKLYSIECDEHKCTFVTRSATKRSALETMERHYKEKHAELELVACFVGGFSECEKIFNHSTLSSHNLKYHREIVPQTCPMNGCTSEKEFTALIALEKHLRGTHSLRGKELADSKATARFV